MPINLIQTNQISPLTNSPHRPQESVLARAQMDQLVVVAAAAVFTLALLILAPPPVSGQVPMMSCTGAMITSFAPCVGYVTGVGGGGSPTSDCCKAFGDLISSSTDCGCLILTGGIPFSIPVNRSMAVNLPSMCNNASVPVFQCKGSSTSGGSGSYGNYFPPNLPFAPSGPDFVTPPTTPTPSPPKVQAPSPPAGLDGLRPLLQANGALSRVSAGGEKSLAMLLVILVPMFLLNKL